MKLIIASNNAHKVAEIKAILAPYFDDICSLKDANIDIDVVEDGKTFAENALKKAREVLAVSDADAALSDDSGLEVDALFGAPGVYSARYAGEGHDDAANNKKLLKDMRDVPMDKRTCRFVSAVALVRHIGEPVMAIGTVEGKLLFVPHGSNGFGYDPLFFYEPEGKTFAELSAEKKNEISHRARALNALRENLEREGK
ncbi:MAG TPA: RdgB/HAM1 family non-canonical purine NTP pyrophosphatase [Clostridia bacterium]|nr:RdgB/HAM1 family non-canonical purine NTP pyrophosphatase [Clostridia bacterium]